MSVRLSREEALAFLSESHTGILTTLRADGMPIALPVWFVVKDERVYVSTPGRTKKVARVRRDSRASFLVESGKRWAELKAVHLTGRARLVDDSDLIEAVAALLSEKYASFRTSRAAMPTRTRAHYAVKREVIELIPDERVLSWDNARLDLKE